MPPKTLRFPNGFETNSSRITRLRIHPDRSVLPHWLFVEVYLSEGLVYRGYVDLNQLCFDGAKDANGTRARKAWRVPANAAIGDRTKRPERTPTGAGLS